MVPTWQTLRYLVVMITGFIAGSRAIDAVRSPTRTFFVADATITALSLAIAGLVWWLLRPQAPERTGG